MKPNPVAASRQSAAKRAEKNAAFCRKPLRLRPELRAFREFLPTQLERDTMLTPQWVAEGVVPEVECFLNATVPENFAERLAAKIEKGELFTAPGVPKNYPDAMKLLTED